MQIARCLPPVLALGGLALFLAPEADSFVTFGTELDLGQRDFRIFNTFNDVEANDNQTPDPNFPGYQGAVMSIWKACIEWQSVLHGDGTGDPHGGNLLGNGGSNFDPSFQGLATEVGSTNDNIHSPLFAIGGATFAFAEGPANDGWRIRYYEDHVWRDGPTDEGGADLQGIAVHEYGHVIGLGHSNASGPQGQTPTMLASTATGIEGRSIELDDELGIRSIYGALDPTKPAITAVSVDTAAAMITVDGVNFASSGNELWFTQYSAGGNGVPVKVSGLTAISGGTSIVAAIPLEAGPGDVLVKVPGGGHEALSNAWPVDPLGPGPIAGSGQPVVSMVQPGQVAALTLDGFTEVDLAGSNLLDTIELYVDGQLLPTGAYKVLHDGLVRIKQWPLVTKLGPVDVRLVTLAGEVTRQVQVLSNDPPLLDLAADDNEGGGLNTDDEMQLRLAGQGGDIVFLFISGSPLPSSFPGYFEFDIGNNFSSLYDVGFHVLPPWGWVQTVLGADETLAGVTIHLQAAVLDVDLPGFLPFIMSNVQTGTFVF